MRKIYILCFFVVCLIWQQSLYAQCEAVTGGTGNGNSITSLPSCGSSTANVNVPHSGFAQLTNLEIGGRYTINLGGGTGANYITVRSGTPTGGAVTGNCTSCTNLTFTATATSHYIVVNQGGCPGTWNGSSATLNYTRVNPPAASVTVSYDCSNTVLSSSGGAGSYQWQGYNGSTWVDISGATGTSYTITGSTNPQYAQYRVRTAYGTCYAFSAAVNVVPRANFTGDITVASNVTMAGVYTINGNFTLNSGVTITVGSGCVLEINAQDITANGTINGNGTGNTGGSGGSGGAFGLASSGNCVRGGQGGAGGAAGSGTGGGSGGNNGGNGSYSCQSCGGAFCIGNSDGCVGGGGGGGGGRGASYGGQGGVGGYAANGNSLSQTPCTLCFIGNTCNASGGGGGGGGSSSNTHGTATGTDIDMGSGGGGAGGGGGGWENGNSGAGGGNGGGGVKLNASRDISISGTISVNGTAGGAGALGSGNSTDNARDCDATSYSCCSICSGYCVWDAAGGNGGGAGGGSGGGIYIAGARNTSVTGILRANGGNGGTAPTNSFGCLDNSRGGGAGGGGRIKIFRNPCGTINISPSEVTYNGGSGGSGPVVGVGGNIGTYNTINHPSYTALAAGTISSAQTICTGGTPAAFTGTASSGGISGSYTYNWFSCTGGSCPTPTSGNPSPGVGWTDRGTNATGFTETTALTSTTTYVRRVTSGVCVEWSNIVTVTVVADPTIPTLNTGSTTPANGTTVCRGATITVHLNDGAGGTGTVTNYYRYSLDNGTTWLPSASGQSWAAGSGTNFNITTNASTTTVLVQTQRQATGLDCGTAGFTQVASWSTVADPTIPTLNTGSTTPATGSTVCRGATITVYLNDGAGGTGTVTNYYRYSLDNGTTWLPSASGQSWAAGSGTNFNITTNVSTTTVLVETQRQATGLDCGTAGFTQVASWAAVVQPSATDPSNTSICQGGTAVLSVTASGGTGPYTYVWQYFNGVSWVSAAAGVPTGSGYTGLGTNSINITGLSGGSGSVIYQYRCQVSTSGTGCNLYTTNGASVTVYQTPTTSNAGSNFTVCALSANMSGNNPSVGTGTWSQISGPGTANFANANAYNSAVSATLQGVYVLRWTIANGVCTASQSDVQVTFSPTTVADAGTDQTNCETTTFTLAANTPTYGAGAWSCISGCSGVSFSNSGSPTSNVNNISYGTSVLRWTVTNGTCSNFDEVSITNDLQPVVTSSGADMCQTQTRTLNSNVGGGIWFAVCGPCVSGNTFTAPVPTGTSQNILITYLSPNTCPNATQTITVYRAPYLVDAGGDVSVCGTTADLEAAVLTVGSGSWSVVSGTGAFTPDNLSYTPTVTGLSYGDNVMRWSATNGVCTVFDDVTVKGNLVTTGIAHAGGTYTATRECWDVSTGWTHYFDNGSDATPHTADDRRIISLSKNGNNIGTVGDGIFSAQTLLETTSNSYGNGYGNGGYYISAATAPYVQNNVNAWAVMGRYWKVTPTSQPNTDVTVKFYFDEQDYQDVLQMAANQNWEPIQVPYLDLQMYKVFNPKDPNPATGHVGIGAMDVQMYDVVNYHPNVKQWSYSSMGSDHVATFDVSSFSGGGGGFGGGGQGALPVELLYLTATPINNTYISVDWATALEINNSGFEIQRSTDALNWTNIGWVPGNNNSTVQHSYQYKDQNAQKGIMYYYRLKQIDNDGHYSYTYIVNAVLNGSNTFNVLDFVPNPTLDQTTLLVTASAGTQISVEFYNGLGQKMTNGKYMLNEGLNSIPFNVEKFGSGTYNAVVIRDSEVFTRKIVVTR